MQCLILAGGLGTRIKNLTGEDLPKALIPILGKPFLTHQLELLKRNGIHEVVFALGFLGEKIEAFCKKQTALGMRFQFVHEGADLRGTGGAIRFAIDHVKMDDCFFVLYGDSYLPIDFQKIWNAFQTVPSAPALMTVFLNQGKWDSSNTKFESAGLLPLLGKISRYQKMQTQDSVNTGDLNYIDYGLAVWRKSAVLQLMESDQKCDLATLYTDLSLDEKLIGYEVFERFYEVGSLQGVKDLENYLQRV